MTYDPTVPQPEDILATSQGELLTNASTTDTGISTDHVALSATEDNGKHNSSIYRFDPSISEPATDQEELALYPVLNPNNIINLFCKYQQIAANEEDDIEAEPGATIGIVPFAAAYFTLNASPAVTINGTAINLSASWVTNTITCTFGTNASNANYFVRLGFGNALAAILTFGEPGIINRTTASFDIQTTSATFSANEEFYVHVYEVP